MLWMVAGGMQGCAEDNAVLEIDFEVPRATSSEAQFLQVQVRRGEEFPFPNVWVGSDPSFELAEGTNQIQLSVVASALSELVHIKLRFCANESCSVTGGAEIAGELWFALERPMYLGERTFWGPDSSTEFPPRGLPTEAIQVDRCSIEGCLTGDAPTSYCRLDGRHFCE